MINANKNIEKELNQAKLEIQNYKKMVSSMMDWKNQEKPNKLKVKFEIDD